MGLEHWDPIRGRWILYRSQEEHRLDCRKCPFDPIPRRIFLDTNIVNLIVKHRETVFEQEPFPNGVEEQAALDAEALMHICSFGFRAPWTMVVCSKSLDEIAETRDPHVRGELLNYAFEVVAGGGGRDVAFAADLGRRIAGSDLLSALPDSNDRELLANAIGLGCDVFCTRDHKTIIRKRERLPSLPIRILSPREWWFHVKPWGPLIA